MRVDGSIMELDNCLLLLSKTLTPSFEEEVVVTKLPLPFWVALAEVV